MTENCQQQRTVKQNRKMKWIPALLVFYQPFKNKNKKTALLIRLITKRIKTSNEDKKRFPFHQNYIIELG